MSVRILANRYEIIEKIGEGGMAIVYKAKDKLLNRFVAVKVLRPEYVKDAEFLSNFKKESQAAAAISHPNIVNVYDVGREGDINYIVMELVTGKALSAYIKEKAALDYHEAIKITKQVASALSVAHKQGIIHRDIKPHNILITQDGNAKIADFGIAKAISNSGATDESSKVIGSVHYFSPEQARGAYVDERSDIYSLGIVLYEMLTGSVPFDGDNPVSIALQHINAQMPRPSDKVKDIPPSLDRIVLKATDKYQTKRYASAEEMIKDLDGVEYVDNFMSRKEKAAVETVIIEESKATREARTKRNKEERQKAREAKVSKASTAIIIVAIVVALLLGIAVLGILEGWFVTDNQEVKVPKFIGHTYEEAVNMANTVGLKIQRSENDIYSPDYEKGFVASQSPSEGAVVGEGKTITVYVSKGKKSGVVPTLTGMTLEEAKDLLTSFGFKVGEVVEVSSDKEAGTVISQSIEGGSTARAGTFINIEVSDGKGEPLMIPDILKKTPEEAIDLLEANGLVIGEVSYEEIGQYEGLVFECDPEVGTIVERGTIVNIVVSKGDVGE